MTIPSAFLFVGPEQQGKEKALKQVQQIICSSKGCGICFDCCALQNKQHYLLTWLHPEASYTIAQLEVVFKLTAFALQPHEHYCIVFERADLFNQASANSLLKLLEEPPIGYHFILLTPRADAVLPTVASRCVTEVLEYTEDSVKHPLYAFFTTCSMDGAADFAKEVERQKALERDVSLLLDQLTSFWHERLLVSISSGNETEALKAAAVEELIQQARLSPPLAGTAKLFFKNLYLNLIALSSRYKR